VEYKVDSVDRLRAAFGSPPNLLYVPGVAASNLLNTALLNQKKLVNQNKEINLGNQNKVKGKYAINNTFDRIQVTKPKNYVFPLDPLVDVAWGFENVITKQTVGYPVLEQVGQDLVSVRIRGVLWDGSEKFPESEVKEFIDLFKPQKIYEVNSRLFNIHGIKSIFIESIQMPSLEGFEDTQPYEIQGYSYKAVELEITDI
jgi:hypothetical protein